MERDQCLLLCRTAWLVRNTAGWDVHASSLGPACADPTVRRSMIPYRILHTPLCHLSL